MKFSKQLTAGSILFLPAVLLQTYFHGNWYSLFHSYSLGMFFGIISYSFLCVSVITSCRIKWIEQQFGQDRLIRYHGISAGIAFIAAVLHLVFKLQFDPEPSVRTITGMAAFGLFTALSITTHLFMIRSPLRKLIPAKLLEKVSLRYNTAKILHNGMIALFVIVIIHVLLAWSTAEQSARLVAIHLTGWGTLLCYLKFRFIRPILAHRGTITAISDCSPSMISVSIILDKDLPRRAGQFAYVTLKTPLCGIEEHPFTISSAPVSGRTVEFVVKKAGLFTKGIAKAVIGSRVIVDGPYGTFTPSPDTKPLLFIAAGVGITPFLSVIRQWYSEKKDLKNPVTLIWTSPSKIDMPFSNELAMMEQLWSNFSFMPFHTREENGKRVTQDDVVQTIAMLRGKGTLDLWFCVPSTVEKMILTAAKLAKLNKRNVHYEKFTS